MNPDLPSAAISDIPSGELLEAPAQLKEPRSCTCTKCVSLCARNPGWMTPQEALMAMEAGLAGRLMRDWLEPSEKTGRTERLYVLAAAAEDCEGRDAPEFEWFEFLLLDPPTKGKCVFLTYPDRRCEIHDSGFKPRQCRESMGCERTGPDNHEMGRSWDSDEGRAALQMWTELNQPTSACKQHTHHQRCLANSPKRTHSRRAGQPACGVDQSGEDVPRGA